MRVKRTYWSHIFACFWLWSFDECQRWRRGDPAKNTARLASLSSFAWLNSRVGYPRQFSLFRSHLLGSVCVFCSCQHTTQHRAVLPRPAMPACLLCSRKPCLKREFTQAPWRWIHVWGAWRAAFVTQFCIFCRHWVVWGNYRDNIIFMTWAWEQQLDTSSSVQSVIQGLTFMFNSYEYVHLFYRFINWYKHWLIG